MSIFKKAWNWLTNLISNTKKYLDKNVFHSITFIDKLKEIVNNPLVDIAVLLTPTAIDDKVLVIVREKFSVAIDALKIADSCLHKETLEEKVQCFIEELRKLSPEMQKAVYHRLAVILTKLSINNNVDANLIAKKIEEVYKKLSEKKN